MKERKGGGTNDGSETENEVVRNDNQLQVLGVFKSNVLNIFHVMS